MFYIKKKFNDGSEIQIPLDDTTVYTHCAFCNKEIAVDLSNLIDEDYVDISCCIFCEDCTKLCRAIKN